MAERDEEMIRGTVQSIVFQNAENGYTVLRLRTEGGDQITVTGTIPMTLVGERLVVAEGILRIRAVDAVEPHGQLRRQAVYGQKLDQAAHAALPPKARRHLGRLRARDAGDLRKARRLVFQHIEALRTKSFHNLRGGLRADALDRA